jgi:hypothetical protein
MKLEILNQRLNFDDGNHAYELTLCISLSLSLTNIHTHSLSSLSVSLTHSPDSLSPFIKIGLKGKRYQSLLLRTK